MSKIKILGLSLLLALAGCGGDDKSADGIAVFSQGIVTADYLARDRLLIFGQAHGKSIGRGSACCRLHKQGIGHTNELDCLNGIGAGSSGLDRLQG